jgi:hypothetical protein
LVTNSLDDSTVTGNELASSEGKKSRLEKHVEIKRLVACKSLD